MSSKSVIKEIKERAASGLSYEWNSNRAPNVDIATAVAELQRINERDDGIRPAVLVEESRPDDAPLHAVFTWEDAIAAELYRQDEARGLMRHVLVVYRDETGEPTSRPVRGFVNVSRYDERGSEYKQRVYRPLPEVMADRGARDAYLEEAEKALAVWRQRYDNIQSFAELYRAIDTLLAG